MERKVCGGRDEKHLVVVVERRDWKSRSGDLEGMKDERGGACENERGSRTRSVK